MRIVKKIDNPIDLHEALLRKSYDHAVICTFAFDSEFFEGYCLDNFNSLSNNGNITVLIDRNVYQKAIHISTSDRPKQANLRYLLYPINVPGAFHPKIFFFVSKNKGRLILGSANMTRAGITSNAELVGCYDYEEQKNEDFKFLFQDTFRLINAISSKWPSGALDSNLRTIEREATWLVEDSKPEIRKDIELLDNLNKPFGIR